MSEDKNAVSANPTTSGCFSQFSLATYSKPKRESQVMVTVGYNTYENLFPDDDMSSDDVSFFGFLVKSRHPCLTEPKWL